MWRQGRVLPLMGPGIQGNRVLFQDSGGMVGNILPQAPLGGQAPRLGGGALRREEGKGKVFLALGSWRSL